MSEPLLRAEGLVKHFVARRSLLGKPLTTVKAVDGVDLDVKAGETLSLVGESGCGKSTVGRLLLRLLEPTGGRVLFDGRDIQTLSAGEMRRLRRHMQLIFQDPFASLNPRMTVYDTVAEPLLLHGLVPARGRRERVAELLTRVGLKPDQAARYPHEFSGGQRQRIVIARALASQPKLIVCDEPVSALDVSIRAQILNLLRDLQRQLGLALIFISHDLAVVKHISDRIAVMYLGRIVETASGERLFENPRHPYTRALLSAIPVPSPEARRNRQILQGDVPSPINPPPGCHLNTRCPFVIERCRVERPLLRPIDNATLAACHRAEELPPPGRLIPVEAQADPRVAALIARFAARSEKVSA